MHAKHEEAAFFVKIFCKTHEEIALTFPAQ
jgi:hypothetical protein